MIDLGALKRAAESNDGDRAVVERTWLKQVLSELTACRSAESRNGQVFGLPEGQRL